MSMLLDSLASAFDGDKAQRDALDAALRAGLPGARNETWKYTSLRALERRRFATPQRAVPAVDAALLADIPSPRVVFVNGRHAPQCSTPMVAMAGIVLSTGAAAKATAETDESGRDADIFARLNFALAREGVTLRVADGVQVREPLHVVHVGTPEDTDVAWHLRHRITLGSGARLALVEHYLCAGEHANLGNSVMAIGLAAHAQLLHARVQDDSRRATLLAQTAATLDESADYRRVDLELGGALSRHILNVRLQGRAASLASNGVLLAGGRQHTETRLGIEHAACDTRCDLLWRGLAAGRARAVFHGGIVIHAGADGADARLSNKNLLLGDDAEIDTQPVLEIHANEVRAMHGATVGQLDLVALFYLRSRGLTEADARRLLTAAFCREVVPSMDSAGLRAGLEQALERALGRVEAA